VNKSIGIIGFGRFGRLARKYLKDDFNVYVYDKFYKNNKEKNMNCVSLEEICRKDIIIISVPVSSFEDVLSEIKDLVKKEAILIDVCAVKEYTCTLMEKYMHRDVEILGTHPLFGPDSAKKNLKGRKIVLSPVRLKESTLCSIKDYLSKKGLVLIELSPREHDIQVSRSLVLTHFIGRAMIDMGLTSQPVDTLGYERLLKILSTVQNDTWELFCDMNKYNKYSGNVRNAFLDSLKKIDEHVT